MPRTYHRRQWHHSHVTTAKQIHKRVSDNEYEIIAMWRPCATTGNAPRRRLNSFREHDESIVRKLSDLRLKVVALNITWVGLSTFHWPAKLKRSSWQACCGQPAPYHPDKTARKHHWRPGGSNEAKAIEHGDYVERRIIRGRLQALNDKH